MINVFYRTKEYFFFKECFLVTPLRLDVYEKQQKQFFSVLWTPAYSHNYFSNPLTCGQILKMGKMASYKAMHTSHFIKERIFS